MQDSQCQQEENERSLQLQQAVDNHKYIWGLFLQLQEDVRELCLAAVQGDVSELSPRLYEAPAAAPTVYAELTPA